MIINATSINNCDNFLLNSLNTIKNFFFFVGLPANDLFSMYNNEGFRFIFFIFFFLFYFFIIPWRINSRKKKKEAHKPKDPWSQRTGKTLMDLKIFPNKKDSMINGFKMKNDTGLWQVMERTRRKERKLFFFLFPLHLEFFKVFHEFGAIFVN